MLIAAHTVHTLSYTIIVLSEFILWLERVRMVAALFAFAQQLLC